MMPEQVSAIDERWEQMLNDWPRERIKPATVALCVDRALAALTAERQRAEAAMRERDLARAALRWARRYIEDAPELWGNPAADTVLGRIRDVLASAEQPATSSSPSDALAAADALAGEAESLIGLGELSTEAETDLVAALAAFREARGEHDGL